MKYTYLHLFVIACLLFSCGGKPTKQTDNSLKLSYTPKYAQGFELGNEGATKVLRVRNPWQGASDVVYSYYLKPDADPKKPDEIKTPVENLICLSTTHIAYIDAIGKTNTIDGVSGSSYVSNATVRQGIADKRVLDVGYEGNLMYETVLSLQPDVVFAYGIGGEFAAIATKLNELGVKVVFFGDYLEDTPLGKTEWLMAVAAFFNCENEAETQLNEIFKNYNDLSGKIKTETGSRPKVMMNAPWRDTWYIPGGKSYMIKLIEDAGGDFIFAGNDKRDSYPISLERAYSEALNADFWLNTNAAVSLDEIKQIDTRLADIPAYKNRKIYNNNARMTAGGGSDFWESGVMNPHIILMDVVKIFHPHILPNHELVYYRQLQ